MRIPTAFKKDVPPGSKVDRFDRGRAELYINMFCPYKLSNDDVFPFVGALFDASRGDPDVKALLLDAPFDWLPDAAADAAAVALSAKFETLWDEFRTTPFALNGLRTLREMCMSQRHAWPEDMVIALFDDPSFDAVAYVDSGK
jgi:hypothetical protein